MNYIPLRNRYSVLATPETVEQRYIPPHRRRGRQEPNPTLQRNHQRTRATKGRTRAPRNDPSAVGDRLYAVERRE